MLDILKFVFSSFWTWAGTAILLSIATEGASRMLASLVMLWRNR